MACFLVMSVSTWFFTWKGWRAAKRREFAAHRKWMWRSYLMLVSAVILRLIDPALRHAGVPDLLSYQASVWLSWVPSLGLFEILQLNYAAVLEISRGPLLTAVAGNDGEGEIQGDVANRQDSEGKLVEAAREGFGTEALEQVQRHRGLNHGH